MLYGDSIVSSSVCILGISPHDVGVFPLTAHGINVFVNHIIFVLPFIFIILLRCSCNLFCTTEN